MDDLGVKHGDKALRRRLTGDLQFWSVALNRLARSGYSKRRGESPLAFSRRVRHSSTASEDALDRLVRLLYHVRFGAHRLDPEERSEAIRLARSLELSRAAS